MAALPESEATTVTTMLDGLFSCSFCNQTMVVVVTVAVIVMVFVLALWSLAWSVLEGRNAAGAGRDSSSRNCRYYCCRCCCWCDHSSNNDVDNDIDNESPERNMITATEPPQSVQITSLTINDLIFNCSMDENGDDDDEIGNNENGVVGNDNIHGSISAGGGDGGDGARNTSDSIATSRQRGRLFLSPGGGRRRRRRRRPASSRTTSTSTTPTTMQQFFPELLADTSVITDEGGDDHDGDDFGSRGSLDYGQVQQQRHHQQRRDDHHRHGSSRNRRSRGRSDSGISGSRFANIEDGGCVGDSNNDNVSHVDDGVSPVRNGPSATTPQPYTRTREDDLQEPLLG